MLFLAAFGFATFCIFIASLEGVQEVFQSRQGRMTSWVLAKPLSGILLAGTGAAAGASVIGIPGSDDAVMPGQINWCVWLFLAHGVAISIFAIWRLRLSVRSDSEGQKKTTSGLRFGMKVWLLATGVYIAGAALDHIWFVRDHKSIGIVPVGGALPDAETLPCQGMMIVRLANGTADYRCTSIVLGDPLSHWPFSPWPGYEGGSSIQLKLVIDRVIADAKKNP